MFYSTHRKKTITKGREALIARLLLGGLAAVIGSGELEGAISSGNTTGDLDIGDGANGYLYINDGDTQTNALGQIASYDPYTGTVKVYDPGSAWYLTNQLRVGAFSTGLGYLSVSDYGYVSSGSNTYVAYYTDTMGHIDLKTSAELKVGNNFFVGHKSYGKLTADSSTINTSSTTFIGTLVGASGVIDLKSSAELNSDFQLSIGNRSYGKLTADNSTINVANATFIGAYSDIGTSGLLDLKSNAILYVGTYFQIANRSYGKLTADNSKIYSPFPIVGVFGGGDGVVELYNGTVMTSTYFIEAYSGNTSGYTTIDDSTLTVGASSTNPNRNLVVIGQKDTATLTVKNGGEVTATYVDGANSGALLVAPDKNDNGTASGVVSVYGPGSKITARGVYVGGTKTAAATAISDGDGAIDVGTGGSIEFITKFDIWDHGKVEMSGGSIDSTGGLLTVHGPSSSDTDGLYGYGTINSDVKNNGLVRGAVGTLTINGDATGTGTFEEVTFAGTLSAGNSPGIVTIDGTSTMLSSNTTIVELIGVSTAGTDYDQIQVVPDALLLLDGILNIDELAFFAAPAAGTFLNVITSGDGTPGSIMGIFSGVTTAPATQYFFGVRYGNLSGGIFTVESNPETMAFNTVQIVTPEPATYALLSISLAIAGMARRRKASTR